MSGLVVVSTPPNHRGAVPHSHDVFMKRPLCHIAAINNGAAGEADSRKWVRCLALASALSSPRLLLIVPESAGVCISACKSRDMTDRAVGSARGERRGDQVSSAEVTGWSVAAAAAAAAVGRLCTSNLHSSEMLHKLTHLKRHTSITRQSRPPPTAATSSAGPPQCCTT